MYLSDGDIDGFFFFFICNFLLNLSYRDMELGEKGRGRRVEGERACKQRLVDGVFIRPRSCESHRYISNFLAGLLGWCCSLSFFIRTWGAIEASPEIEYAPDI